MMAQVQRRNRKRRQRHRGEGLWRFALAAGRERENQDDDGVPECQGEKARGRHTASSDDGNGLEHTTDRTESVREEGQSSRSRGPLRRRRPRGGIDDNCWKKAERTVGERREPG